MICLHLQGPRARVLFFGFRGEVRQLSLSPRPFTGDGEILRFSATRIREVEGEEFYAFRYELLRTTFSF